MKFRVKCLAGIVLFISAMTFISCDKEDPIDPGKEAEDTTFSFSCTVRDIPWDGSGKAAASNQIKQIFPQVDSLPQAFFMGDTLMLGVGGLYNDYQATMLIAIKVADKNNLKGTYNFSKKIGSLETGKAIGVFDGSSSDFLVYVAGLDFLEYVDSSRIIITDYKNNRISGNFQFSLEHLVSEERFNTVTSGTFKNFKIKQ